MILKKQIELTTKDHKEHKGKRLKFFLVFYFFLFTSSFLLCAQPSWQQEFAKMPLTEKVPELDRHNCVRIMLNSFQSNAAVQALIFLPGATDEFYFFRRARASLTNAAPTLLDAVIALTNQTYLRATLVPPFLLLHTAEDPLEPLVVIEDQPTADRMKRKHFEKHAVFNDLDWDHVGPMLGFDFNTHISPKVGSHDSYHFFRNSFAEFGLGGWDALRAVALASKAKFTVKKNWIAFAGDSRTLGQPAKVDGFLLRDAGVIK
jgi:hypothetical protein